MIKRTVNLASDLEWMLRSQQVDDQIIIDMLLRDYYLGIYEFAISKLTYPQQAEKATRDAFISAVRSAKNDPPESSIVEWLNSIAAEVTNEQGEYITEQHLRNSKSIKALLNQRSH